MSKHSIALYIIGYETSPNYVIRKAFEKHFSPVHEYDWYKEEKKVGPERSQKIFINILRKTRPEYCFMQIQNAAAMSVQTIREISRYTKVINWTGDVKDTADWYDWLTEVGRAIHLTLFTNETDVKILRERGVRADYLQVGFDHLWYYKRNFIQGWPEIVFCANYYSHYPLSGFRAEVANAMKEEFGVNFGLYGSNWQKIGIKAKPIGNPLEAEAYNSSKIALSVSSFNYERYHSDRLLRIMACGQAIAMSHGFARMTEDFIPDGNLVVFKDVPDLIYQCKKYLVMDFARERIAADAYRYVHDNCQWDHRCRQLIELLRKHDIKVPSY